MTGRALFSDTWGFLALANRRDGDHEVAAEADRWRQDRRWAVVTSDYVVDETLTALAVSAGGDIAVRFLDSLLVRVRAGRVLLLEVDRLRRDRAFAFFRRLAPTCPRLSLTDCTSFALMLELDVELAFTADRHFHRAGPRVRPLFERRPGGRVVARLPPDA